MFLKIEGPLLDVLGEKARGDIKGEFGIELSPQYQFLEGEIPVSLAIVTDQAKADQLTHDNRVTVLNTVEDFNSEIDNLFEEKYILKDSTALMIDLQLSGKTVSSIVGYDTNKSMTDNANLKALYEAGLSGISKTQKPPYLTSQ